MFGSTGMTLSLFDIFETPALEEDGDEDIFAPATSFDVALFEIFENPALEDIDDSPSATSFDVALFDIFEDPVFDEDEDEDINTLTPITPSSETMIGFIKFFLYDCFIIMLTTLFLPTLFLM
ncbi:hypothetical protein BASA60_008470 [Batrachochytrium salamandrivorans]|nr:hypothetical protein BASA60_008470 [Batrachochytrium salamandrivorans]